MYIRVCVVYIIILLLCVLDVQCHVESLMHNIHTITDTHTIELMKQFLFWILINYTFSTGAIEHVDRCLFEKLASEHKNLGSSVASEYNDQSQIRVDEGKDRY